jgi:hypothetical protein
MGRETLAHHPSRMRKPNACQILWATPYQVGLGKELGDLEAKRSTKIVNRRLSSAAAS